MQIFFTTVPIRSRCGLACNGIGELSSLDMGQADSFTAAGNGPYKRPTTTQDAGCVYTCHRSLFFFAGCRHEGRRLYAADIKDAIHFRGVSIQQFAEKLKTCSGCPKSSRCEASRSEACLACAPQLRATLTTTQMVFLNSLQKKAPAGKIRQGLLNKNLTSTS